jgi:DNA-directed RNA polymerase specialized sigma24 family protein
VSSQSLNRHVEGRASGVTKGGHHGDTDRLAYLWRWRPNIEALARHRGATRETSADVASEVYAIAWARLDRVPDDDEGARRWLYRTATFVTANMSRRVNHQAHIAERLRLDPASETVSPDQVFYRVELLEAFGSLSSKDQRLLLQAALGLRGAGLAKELGCSPSAASTRLSRSRGRLRNAIDM